ncbi:MAG: DUF1552 domain-containing protein [Bryobacterales bacterium]|nr:DUF1552 domain-containing protein [Bryobacterales bacterium]
MIVPRKPLSRRTMLRGLGATLALPALEAMAAKTAPLRMAFVYVPNGIIMEQWTPAGNELTLTRVLQPMAAHRERMLLFTGLAHNNGRALGDGAGDHARASASFLTGVHPRKTDGADIQNGISVDQVAARSLGEKTRFASLELGLEHGRQAGNCDSGYSCAYTNSLAWRGEATPLPPEVNPRLVFERLFGAGETAETRRDRKSVLDFVREDAAALQRDLGGADRRKMDEYLTGVREIEKRIGMAERQAAEAVKPEFEAPVGIPADFDEYAKLMFDLMTVALRTDSTRILTMMMGREGSNMTYRQAGVNEAHHQLSHHQGDAEKIEKLTKINVYHAGLLAQWVTQLAKTADGDGSLLDNTMVVYGSGISDGNRHLHHDLPALLVGGSGARMRLGRHVRYGKETPMTNLWLALLDRMGVRPELLGDSTGRLEGLTDL